MHAFTSKMTSRHTACHMHDMYISRRIFIIHLLCSSRSQNVSSVMSLLEYFLQKPAKKTTTKKMASYSYSSFTPVPFARNAHTESHSTGIGLITLGRRRICCVYFCSQFCLYTSVSLTKSSTLRACHQKKMLSTVQMQDLLPEGAQKTFLFLRDNAGLRAAESILKFKIVCV